MRDAYYFGVLDDSGHEYHAPGDEYLPRDEEKQIVWQPEEIDGCLQPGCHKNRWGHWEHGSQKQGPAVLHYKDGWTALSFWDRSGDSRPGSHSTFILRGTHEFDVALEIAKMHFPEVFERIKFSVVLAGA